MRSFAERARMTMAQDREQLETLHQQASTLYLQGEYHAALLAWREVLKLDPGDERATEGVRLCELLTKDADSQPPPSARPAPATPSPAAAGHVGFGIGEDLDESLDGLDELLQDSGGADWMDEQPAAPAPAVVPEPGDGAVDRPVATADAFEMLDLEIDSPGLSQQNAAAPSTAAPTLEPEAPAPDMASLAAEFLQDDTTRTDDRAPDAEAAAELEQRVNELMAEAMQFYERGERDQALAVLDRLAILDEDNEAARMFAEHIRAEMDDGSASAPGPTEPAATPAAAELPAEPVAPEPIPDLNHQPMEFGSEIGGSLSLDVEPPAEPDGADAAAAQEAPAAPRPRPRRAAVPTPATRPSPTRWMVIAAVVLLLGSGGYLALQLMGRDGGGDSVAPPLPMTGANPGNNATGGSTTAGVVQPDPTPVEPTTGSPADLQAALDNGRRAFDAGDYAQAIVAYNLVLEIDAQNAEARHRLNEAGELYREQKAVLDQRAEAIEAFNQGDYRNALRLFYRLPANTPNEKQRINRYVRNGWYNMGVYALVREDCRTARDNFGEARQLDTADPGVLRGLQLAAECSSASRSSTYYDDVKRLALRTLDD